MNEGTKGWDDKLGTFVSSALVNMLFRGAYPFNAIIE